MYYKKLGSAIESGIYSGCPFCNAIILGIPKPGDLIRILTGYDAGMVARVVHNQHNIPLRNGEFLITTSNDPPGWTHTISGDGPYRILFDHMPPSTTPDWAPPICLKYAGELDAAVIRFWGKSLREDGSLRLIPSLFFEIITYIWYNRLPLKPEELWSVLEAHGFPYDWKERLTQLYQDGKDLLIYAIGRKPFKNRRVKPFSIKCKR